MVKFTNSKKRGKWKIFTGNNKRGLLIRSKKPGKWKIKFKFGSKNRNKMKKMDKLPKMKKMNKMAKMKKMHKIAKLPKLKMKHK